MSHRFGNVVFSFSFDSKIFFVMFLTPLETHSSFNRALVSRVYICSSASLTVGLWSYSILVNMRNYFNYPVFVEACSVLIDDLF